MHATIPQQELAAAVTWAAKQLPTKPTNPVLAGMRLQSVDSRLRLSVWDGMTAAHAEIDADIHEDGIVVTPGQMLQQVVGSLRKSEVTITDTSGDLEVTTLGAHFTLTSLDSHDYPALPSTPAAHGSVDGSDFAAAYKRVKAAMDPRAEGPFAGMSGIRVRVAGDTLTLTATDRYRIATAVIPWQSDKPVEAMGVIPGKTLADNAAAIDGRLHLALPADGSGTCGMTGGGRQVSTMLIDPTLFPHRVDQLTVPKTGLIVGQAPELIDGIRAAMAVSESGKPVWINAGETGVTFRAGRDSRSVVEVDARYEGESDVEVAINSTYLLDGLTPIVGTAHIDVSTPKLPALIYDPADDTYRYVVIPIRDPHKNN
ncbi:hypothetical protein ACIPY6_28460 [Streptomyces sp. NPDC090054]|uniref:DNA polymerase III subunit beta n=1 Tax=Streptomyces sp. NPDC090054 TaxID=3365933 RepID=UPI0037F727EE